MACRRIARRERVEVLSLQHRDFGQTEEETMQNCTCSFWTLVYMVKRCTGWLCTRLYMYMSKIVASANGHFGLQSSLNPVQFCSFPLTDHARIMTITIGFSAVYLPLSTQSHKQFNAACRSPRATRRSKLTTPTPTTPTTPSPPAQ